MHAHTQCHTHTIPIESLWFTGEAPEAPVSTGDTQEACVSTRDTHEAPVPKAPVVPKPEHGLCPRQAREAPTRSRASNAADIHGPS